MLCRRSISPSVLIACLLTIFCLSDVPASAQPPVALDSAPGTASIRPVSIDTKMLPEDALAVAALFPQQMLADPQMKLMPVEVASAWTIENIGVDIQNVDSITVSVGSPSPQGVEFGALIRFTKDFDPRLLKKELIAGPAEMIGGYRANPMTVLDNFFLHRIDAKTYIVATPDHLVKMLANNGSTGPLAQLVADQKGNSPLVAAMVMEPVREQVLDGLAQMPPEIPGPLRELAEIPRLLQGVFVDLGVLPGNTFRLTLMGNNEQDAVEMATIMNDAMAFGKDLFVMQAMQQVEGTGAVPEATRLYIRRLGDELVSMLEPQRTDNQLVMELENQAGIATSGVLVGLLLPAVQSAREAARRMSSQNNLKQMILAFHNYHDAYRQFPLPISRDEDGKPLLSWRVAILPFIEQQELYDQFHLDEPWDSEHNIKLLEKMPIIYADPSLSLPLGMTNYQVPVGEELIFKAEGKTSFAAILDGTSNTIAIFEASADAAVPWTKPSDAEIAQENPLANMGKHRPGGFNAAMADGSVRFISENIDPELFWKLLTRAGGEPVSF